MMYSLDKFIRENDTDGKVKESIASCLVKNMTKGIALDTLASDLQKRLYDFIFDSETMDIDSGSNVERAFTTTILTILEEYFYNQKSEKDIYDKMAEFIVKYTSDECCMMCNAIEMTGNNDCFTSVDNIWCVKGVASYLREQKVLELDDE